MINLFTPRRMRSSGEWERLQLSLNDEDMAKVRRGYRWTAVVTDQDTGKRYRAWGADCGLPGCFCDAVVTEIKNIPQGGNPRGCKH